MITMKRVLLIFFCLPLISFGQFLPKTINGSDIKQLNDGGYILAKTSSSFKSYSNISTTLGSLEKRDSNGNYVWNRELLTPSSGLSKASSVQICDDGGFIVAGTSTFTNTTSDASLSKIDRDGNIIWVKSFGFGNSNFDKANSVQICDDGGFIVAGVSDNKAYLFKTDMNGNLIWENKFSMEGSYRETANSVQICKDGGFIVAGTAKYNSGGWASFRDNAYLFKTDSNGNLIWEKRFGIFFNPDNDTISNEDVPMSANSVQICDDGGFIFTGTSNLTEDFSQAYLQKIDSDGHQIWRKYFRLLSHANSLQRCDDGGFILAGKSKFGKASLLKTDKSGKKLWQNNFIGTDIHIKDHSSVSSVQICSDNGYVMLGTHLIKTNAYGEVYESDLIEKISSFVESRINTWQGKGEFEKTSEYQIRVTQSARDSKIKSIQREAIIYFKKEYLKQIKFENISLNSYDADNETFSLNPFPLKPFLLAVPISEAPYFKQNFNSVNFSNVDFIIKDKNFILSNVDLLVGDKTYTYDISDKNEYGITKFNYNFDKIYIDVQESSFSNNITTSNNTINIGKSIVDSDIPENKKITNRFALVIGNEDYNSYQRTLNNEQNVDYAENDATIFKQYCLNTLGVKEENMHFLINATAAQMSQEIDLVSKILLKLVDKAELIVYYSGHGFPDEQTKTPYLIPVDVNASNLSSAIKLEDFYTKLSSTNASKITVFLDACFTGGGRNKSLVSSRGIKIKPKQGSLSGNLVVFSASNGNQSSLPFHKEKHGMFTYHLLKKFQESKGSTTFGELYSYLKEKVSLESLKVNKTEQDPKINVSNQVESQWLNWKF